MVWQDMPNTSGGPKWVRDINVKGPEMNRDAQSSEQFHLELKELVNDFGNHPSIVMWVPFNERWGQFDTAGAVKQIRQLDPSRPINAASGGNFCDVGDVLDVHSYPDPAFPRTDDRMAVVCGEFGGLGLPLKGHTWQSEKNWAYRNYETSDALNDAFEQKLSLLRPMIRKGLAAAVYTQTTDVEREVNGLMTYDRAVNKIDPDRAARSVAGLFSLKGVTGGEQ